MSGGLVRVSSLLCSTQHSPGAAAGGLGSAVQVQLSPREDGGVSLLITPLPSPAASLAASPRSSVASLRAEVCWPPTCRRDICGTPAGGAHPLQVHGYSQNADSSGEESPVYVAHTHNHNRFLRLFVICTTLRETERIPASFAELTTSLDCAQFVASSPGTQNGGSHDHIACLLITGRNPKGMNPGLKEIRTGRSAKGRSYLEILQNLAVDLSAQVGLARANSLSALTDDSGSSAARASQLSFEHLSDHFAPPSGSSGEQVRSPHRLPPILDSVSVDDAAPRWARYLPGCSSLPVPRGCSGCAAVQGPGAPQRGPPEGCGAQVEAPPSLPDLEAVQDEGDDASDAASDGGPGGRRHQARAASGRCIPAAISCVRQPMHGCVAPACGARCMAELDGCWTCWTSAADAAPADRLGISASAMTMYSRFDDHR